MCVCTAAEKTEKKEKIEKKDPVVVAPVAPEAKTLPPPPPAADPSKVLYVRCLHVCMGFTYPMFTRPRSSLCSLQHTLHLPQLRKLLPR